MTTPRVHPAPAPTPPPPRHGSALVRILRRAFSPFWVVPALWCVGAFVAGVLLPEVDEQLAEQIPFLFQAGPDGARTFLSSIAGAMISVTGLVFSITIVVLQLASSQFSPRVLRTFLDQRTPQMTLGVFTASFVYALTVMRSVEGTEATGSGGVPQLAVTVAFLMVLASVGMFLAFIHHITQAISVDTIIDEVGDDTRSLLERSTHGRTTVTETGSASLPDLGSAVVVTTEQAGYLNLVDAAGLCRLAHRHDVRVSVLHPLGTYLVQDSPLAVVHGGSGHAEVDWTTQVRRHVVVGWRRTMEQDVSFGLRQLVDIGERALSPGVNDPTTAGQVVDELHSLLVRIAAVDDLSPVLHDDDGAPRVVTTEWTFGEYLDLCVDEIAHWGASSIQVPRRLDDMLTQLATVATDAHRPVIERKRTWVGRIATAPGET
ncbi:DUF2254 domain-containing protein [Ornithinimicrobium sediminis]|uniref:DUF2254 domain-containing protein n=1 Tax=Ornithinimicrobium sediminis TaxID=2904603 RepID=UPI001E2F67C7|nr:DUF2254 domain-containing protein [Ornithinimicrobium sediminis]MCE0487701.1 DUF2254 domain-containing protein [Ornithinimicrobium sediminis]